MWRFSNGVLAVAAAPPLLVAAWLLLIAAGPRQRSFWAIEPMTLPEAAALQDGATIRRLVAQGADPNRADVVRADILGNDAVVVTPLEAATRVDASDSVILLLDLGAAPAN